MSGDCTKQPLIFYSKEITDTKIALLSHYGIQLMIKENKYYYNSVLDNEDLQRVSRGKQSKQNQIKI